jgi:hypothetical protein
MKPFAAFGMRRLFAALMLSGLGLANVHAETRVVPMNELIAEPQRFDGQTIRVVGFLRLEFEKNGLFLMREDYNNTVTEHALWLDLKNAQLRSSSKLNHGHVIIEGRFALADKARGGKWGGALTPVSSLRMWRKPRTEYTASDS